MTEQERERVLARIAEIEQTLRDIKSVDLRRTLRQAIADCQAQLDQIDARDQQPAIEGA